ncbi:MAG TPA: VWA domain-containing protein [Terracidiphilus sp.]|nr:VWA domain-containing protein [Terracidiphilus sp.]
MGHVDLATISHRYLVGVAVGLFAVIVRFNPGAAAQASPATGAEPGRRQESSDPVLTNRPPPKPNSQLSPEGKIKLDVVVNDGAGKSVQGLQPWDFKILDNGQPRKVMSFRAFSDAEVKPDPPVEVMLVIDMVNLPFQQVAFTRQEIAEFLQQDGGHLKQPVRLLLLTDAGMRVQPRASIDGDALLSVVNQIKGGVRTLDSAMGGEGLLERFQRCSHQMTAIAENEARVPGRKLLIWVGPGWPMLNRPDLGYYSEKDQQRYFDGIVELSTKLREARMVVSSVAPSTNADATYSIRYMDYLKPVRWPRESDSGDLSLKVLATQTGGRILGPNNDVANQIKKCIADANDFYRISFDPPVAQHADEYHDLKVVVDKPGLTVRTNSGYYNEPAGK